MEQILKKDIEIPDWSFKSKDADAYRKLEKSIAKHGQLKSILVRRLKSGKYEVIDGKIVLEILKRNDKDYVWCEVVKDISKTDAKLLYLQLNYDFDLDYIELAKAIKKLTKKYSSIEISRLVNLTVKEINDLVTLNGFDFEKYKPIQKQNQQSFL